MNRPRRNIPEPNYVDSDEEFHDVDSELSDSENELNNTDGGASLVLLAHRLNRSFNPSTMTNYDQENGTDTAGAMNASISKDMPGLQMTLNFISVKLK